MNPPLVVTRLLLTLGPALVLCLCATGPASADQILLRSSEPHFSPGAETNVLLVQLVNDAPLQGLQFSLAYDPAVAHPIAVTGLGRVHDSLGLHYLVAPTCS